jgi:hypothetical protein
MFSRIVYGVVGDLVDDHMRMGESTCLEAMYNFCRGVVAMFGHNYLRAECLGHSSARGDWGFSGFPWMLGSIDCMHWEWKNCSLGWQGAVLGPRGGLHDHS